MERQEAASLLVFATFQIQLHKDSLLTRPWAVWQMTACGPTPMWTYTGLDGPFHSAFIPSPSSTMEAGALTEHIS